MPCFWLTAPCQLFRAGCQDLRSTTHHFVPTLKDIAFHPSVPWEICELALESVIMIVTGSDKQPLYMTDTKTDDGAKTPEKPEQSTQSMMVVADSVIGAAVLVFIGVWAGNFADDKFHTAPWGSIFLSLLGGCLGLWRMVKKAMAIDTRPPSGKLPPPIPFPDDDDPNKF